MGLPERSKETRFVDQEAVESVFHKSTIVFAGILQLKWNVSDSGLKSAKGEGEEGGR